MTYSERKKKNKQRETIEVEDDEITVELRKQLTPDTIKHLWTIAIKSNVAALRSMDTKDSKNMPFVRLALSLDPTAIVYVDNPTMRTYEEAVRLKPEAIKYVPRTLSILSYLTRHCNNEVFKHMDPTIFNTVEYDDDQMMNFINQNKPYAIRFYRGSNINIYIDVLRRDPQIIYYLSRFNWLTINNIMNEQLMSTFITIVKDNAMFTEVYKNLNYIQENDLMNFIRKDPDNIRSVHRNQLTPSLVKAVLKYKKELIKYLSLDKVFEPKSVAHTIVDYDGLLIQYIDEPYCDEDDIKKTAVKNNVYALNYIENPSLELIHIAYQSDPDNFVFIKNRCPKVVEYCEQYGIELKTYNRYDIDYDETRTEDNIDSKIRAEIEAIGKNVPEFSDINV